MKDVLYAIGMFAAFGAALYFIFTRIDNGNIIRVTTPTSEETNQVAGIASMNIESAAFQNDKIPPKYTCDGENISPPLIINNLPENTQSIALIFYDPDVPVESWIHWLVWNIPASETKLAENRIPTEAKEGINSFGDMGYGGPCPPSGTHNYVFIVYALDTFLNLNETTDKTALENAMNNHILAQAQMTGRYR